MIDSGAGRILDRLGGERCGCRSVLGLEVLVDGQGVRF